jgi:hypothetical protein
MADPHAACYHRRAALFLTAAIQLVGPESGVIQRNIMRITHILAYTILSLTLAGCSGVEIQPAGTDRFIAGNYVYYNWRTDPLPSDSKSSDPMYAIDPVMRREINADLQSKGYVLNSERAQFTVGYILSTGKVQGDPSAQASNN